MSKLKKTYDLSEADQRDLFNLIQQGTLKNLGFVQRFGFGIAEARRAMAANGNPLPEFQVEPTNVLAILRLAPAGGVL